MADINEPSADDQIRETYRLKMRTFEQIAGLDLDRRYMVVALKLTAPATADDYAIIRDAIAAIPKVATANRIATHKTRASVPAGSSLVMRIEVGIGMEN